MSPNNSNKKSMTSLKKLTVISMSFGVGFAITIALVLGAFFWYQNKPKPPKPWDENAITATYDSVDTEGKNNTIFFSYTLENNTNLDYSIDGLSNMVLLAKLKKQDSLSGRRNDEWLKPDPSIFIPSKERFRFLIHLAYPGVNPSDCTKSS